MRRFVFNALLIGCILGIVLLTSFVLPPFSKAPEMVTVSSGSSVDTVARLLEENNIIRSADFFSLVVRFWYRSHVVAGVYDFKERPSVFGVAARLSSGDTGVPLIKVTIPEGVSAREIALILTKSLPNFDGQAFLVLAKNEEGYLFPETYLFSADISPEGVVRAMREEFQKQTAPLQAEVDAFGVSLADVVIMASLLEKEARLYETRQKVAGILWKRLKIGMPLQTDAVFGYILERDTFSPTLDDLQFDSPYNTYLYAGLPIGPIGNPGLEALRAAVNPIQTPYLYYLTGKDGTMHYAETFDEHVANRRFLR